MSAAPPPATDSELLATLAEELSSQPRERVLTAESIVKHALDLVSDADHASLTVRAQRGTFVTPAATSALALELDQAQYGLGEGPCVSTALEGEWCRSGDLATDARWPKWGPMAAGHGIHSMLSLRILRDGKPLGALNLYAEAPGSFAEGHDVDMAILYAVHAANALVAARLVGDLQTALDTRHVIGLAQGMLMERYRLDTDRSFAMLVRLSNHANRKIRDIAAEIAQGHTAPNG